VAAITRPDDGTLVVAALTWVGWLSWATLAVSIIVEIPAAVRGVSAPRLPALGLQQRVAAGLVAAAALLFTGGTASLASGPQTAYADSAPTIAATAAPDETSNPPDSMESVERVEPRIHIVERGDTLWDIAGTHLGDEHRYPGLYEASKHTTQPDGRRLTDPDLIYPGWKITIPTGADDSAPDDGPTDAKNVDGEDATDVDGLPSPSSHAIHDNDLAYSRSAPTNPTVAPPRTAEPAQTPDPTPPRLRTSDLAGATDSTDEGDDDGPVDVCTVGGIGAALAGGLLFFLGAQRARQHRHRRPGQRIALPADAGTQIENELRGVDDPVTFDHVNRALRTLAARCAMTGTALPPVRLARLIAGQLELHLAASADLPAPFLPTASPTLWVLDPDGDVLDADQADDYPAPYPSLVTVGHDLDGGLILVDLEHVGALAADGDPADVSAVLNAIAAELATSLWSNDVRVSIIGAPPDLAQVLDAGRVRHLGETDRDFDQLMDEMTDRAAADRAALNEVGVPGLQVARSSRVAEGVWAPEILLIARRLTSVQRDRLTRLIHAEPRVAIAAVTTSGPPLTEWAIRLHLSDTGQAMLDPVGLAVTPQRVGPENNGSLIDLLAATHAAPTAAAPTWHVETTGEPGLPETPGEPEPTTLEEHQAPPKESGERNLPPNRAPSPDGAVPDLADPNAAPLVAVLGPVEIHHARELAEPSKRGQLTALAAYLALHPGQSRDSVDEAMWPGSRVTLATRNTAMTKLRNWLGADPDGNDYLPRADTDGYRLHPSIQTDWHLFTELLPNGPARASTSDLIAALDLVRDQPFKGVNPRRYIWAERIQQEMTAAIGDVAAELARRALLAEDHRLALKAVMTGLTAEPGSEMIWRYRLRAHHAAGDRVALRQAADQLTALADELGGDLEDETTELLQQLLKSAPRPAVTSRRTP
jgi:DNA-binding SARP family transcriptional activator